MGLCTGEKKKRKAHKIIVIPKGVINPDQNNIIEIPLNLDANSSLVVKAPSDPNACFTVEPFTGGLHPGLYIPGLTQEDESQKALAGRYTDFSTQTPPMIWQQQGYPLDQTDYSLPQSSFMYPQPPFYPPTHDIHSPMCPISPGTSGYRHPSSGRLNRTYNSFLPRHDYSISRDLSGMSSRPPIDFNTSAALSEATFRRTAPTPKDDESLNKMIEDKVEKMLRPVLSTLQKTLMGEDELDLGSDEFSPKLSSSIVEPEFTRRKASFETFSPNFDRTLRQFEEEMSKRKPRSPEKDSRMKDSFNSTMKDSFNPSVKDSFNAPGQCGCPSKRGGVSFDQWNSTMDSDKSSDMKRHGSRETMSREY